MRRDTLEKYTCLRRSTGCSTVASRNRRRTAPPRSATVPNRCAGTPSSCASASAAVARSGWHVTTARRSEEHTSELQSRLHLVCRLLLEKKKKKMRLNNMQHSRRRVAVYDTA